MALDGKIEKFELGKHKSPKPFALVKKEDEYRFSYRD